MTVRHGFPEARVALIALLALALVPAGAAGTEPAAGTGAGVFALVRALDEAGTKGLWPGFDPSALPLAVFDGERTYLFRHPAPPAGFSPVPGRPGVLSAPGRYPAVAGNSTREIGGVRTATVVATPPRSLEEALLAVVEEVFHVFWLARHPSTRPDEMARYVYPLADAENLRLLLGEDEALARAIEAEGEAEAAGWAALALAIRGERVPRLPDEVRAWETALEAMEGTANAVARRAAGQGARETSSRLRQERSAAAVRWRFYDSGTALFFLLDRLEPGWKARSDAEPHRDLVSFLAEALARRGARPAAFAPRDEERVRAAASAGVQALASRRLRLREEVLSRPGARVVVEAAEGSAPFRLERFDPVDLFVLDGGEVAHPSFLTVSGGGGRVEVTNPAFARGSFAGTVALTAAAGRHPLRDGIRRVTVTGLASRPRVERSGGRVTVEAEGLRLALPDAEVETGGETTRVRIGGRRGAPGDPEP